MELTQDLLNLIINKLSRPPIAVTKSGSGVLPFINNARDVDYIFFFSLKDGNDAKKLYNELNYIKNNIIGIASQKDDICFLVRDIKKCHNYFFGLKYYSNNFLNPWTYLEYYQKVIYGNYTNVADILGKDRELYKQSLKKSQQLIVDNFGNVLMSKLYYYLLISCYILKNNSFNAFTEEQIENINALHDVNNIIKYTKAKTELDSLMNELDNL